jgi:hypothetical protein
MTTEVAASRVPNQFRTGGEPVPHRRNRAPKADKTSRKRRSVLLLVVCFTYSPTANGNFVGRIAKHINAPFKAAMHSKLGIALVIQTAEASEELVDRLRPILEGEAVENIWCYTPVNNVASLLPLDPLTDYVKEAWKAVNTYNNPPKRPSRSQILLSHQAGDDPAGAVRHALLSPKRREAK